MTLLEGSYGHIVVKEASIGDVGLVHTERIGEAEYEGSHRSGKPPAIIRSAYLDGLAYHLGILQMMGWSSLVISCTNAKY